MSTSNTLTALYLTYGTPLIPLSQVCEDLFGLSYKKALEKAAIGELGVPIVRLNESRKCPPCVHVADLAEKIDTEREIQKAELRKLGNWPKK